VYTPIPTILADLTWVLYLALAVVLVRKYLRTRDAGFVWLGVAVVIWPLVSRFLDHGEGVLFNRIITGHPVGFYPFSLVEQRQMSIVVLADSLISLQQLIGVCLMLVAALYLYKAKSNSTHEEAG